MIAESHRFLNVVGVLFAMTCLGCSQQPPQNGSVGVASPIEFDEIGEQAGIRTVYNNGRTGGFYAILESLGGGTGIIDFDLDGRLDLVFPGGGQLKSDGRPFIQGAPLVCYRQRASQIWDDVSERAGVDIPTIYTHGVAIGDFDSDGFDDLLITGYGQVNLWQNSGDGTFELVTGQTGLADSSWSSSAAWADLDGDGFLDLYVAHYVDWSLENNPECPAGDPRHSHDVCPPRRFQPLTDAVYRNQGDGTWQDMTAAWGLVPGGKGLGVFAADIDEDGDTDLYVANDTTNNFLYLNQGDGQLQEMGLFAGCAVDHAGKPNGSMGLAWFDFDGDLREDLWITNFEDENSALYRNLGSGTFLHTSLETGISAVGNLYVGFGTAAEDFDGDGDRDLVIANGHVIYYPTRSQFEQEPLFLENSSGRFQRLKFSDDSYFSKPAVGRGLATGDLNQDGRCDIVISNLNSPPAILINQSPMRGKRLRLRLVGTSANRNAIGARVVLHCGRHQDVRSLIGGGSYLSTSERTCDFYVSETADSCSATVYWPGGKAEEIRDLNPGRDYLVVEGKQTHHSPDVRQRR